MRQGILRVLLLATSFSLTQIISYLYKDAIIYKFICVSKVESSKIYFLITNLFEHLISEINICSFFTLYFFFLFLCIQIVFYLFSICRKYEFFYIKNFFKTLVSFFYFFNYIYTFLIFPGLIIFVKNFIEIYDTYFFKLNIEMNFANYQALFSFYLLCSYTFIFLFCFIYSFNKISRKHISYFALLSSFFFLDTTIIFFVFLVIIFIELVFFFKVFFFRLKKLKRFFSPVLGS